MVGDRVATPNGFRYPRPQSHDPIFDFINPPPHITFVWPNFKCYFRFEGLRVVLGVRIVSQAVLRQENQNFGLS